MTVARGEIWLADLGPVRGSEQAGVRPVLIFQNDILNKSFLTTLAIPLTTNLRLSSLPSCIRLLKGEGGLDHDSIALCHQLRVVDRRRLRQRLGEVTPSVMTGIERCVLFALGFF